MEAMAFKIGRIREEEQKKQESKQRRKGHRKMRLSARGSQVVD